MKAFLVVLLLFFPATGQQSATGATGQEGNPTEINPCLTPTSFSDHTKIGTCKEEVLQNGESCVPTCDEGYKGKGQVSCPKDGSDLVNTYQCTKIESLGCKDANKNFKKPNIKAGNCKATLTVGQFCSPMCQEGFVAAKGGSELERKCKSGSTGTSPSLVDNGECLPDVPETPETPAGCLINSDLKVIDAMRHVASAGNCSTPLAVGERCYPACVDGYIAAQPVLCGIEENPNINFNNLLDTYNDCIKKQSPFCLGNDEDSIFPFDHTPGNGGKGDCSASGLRRGEVCTPVCNEGFSSSGERSCNKDGIPTDSFQCDPQVCADATDNIPANGELNDCGPTLAWDQTCSPTCNIGYLAEGTRHCKKDGDSGTLTDTFKCVQTDCVGTDAIANLSPQDGTLGDCEELYLQFDTSCQPDCNAGFKANEGVRRCHKQGGGTFENTFACIMVESSTDGDGDGEGGDDDADGDTPADSSADSSADSPADSPADSSADSPDDSPLDGNSDGKNGDQDGNQDTLISCKRFTSCEECSSQPCSWVETDYVVFVSSACLSSADAIGVLCTEATDNIQRMVGSVFFLCVMIFLVIKMRKSSEIGERDAHRAGASRLPSDDKLDRSKSDSVIDDADLEWGQDGDDGDDDWDAFPEPASPKAKRMLEMTEVRRTSGSFDGMGNVDTPVVATTQKKTRIASLPTTKTKVTLNLKNKSSTNRLNGKNNKKKRSTGKKKFNLKGTPPASPKIEADKKPSLLVSEAPPDIFGMFGMEAAPKFSTTNTSTAQSNRSRASPGATSDHTSTPTIQNADLLLGSGEGGDLGGTGWDDDEDLDNLFD